MGIAQQTVSIIPQPVSLTVDDGHFTIDKNTSIIFNTKENDLRLAANFFNAFIKNVSGDVLPLNVKNNKSILLEIKKTETVGAKSKIHSCNCEEPGRRPQRPSG